MSLYTPTDIEFLRMHLPTKGSTWCAKHLKRHPESMLRKARELGIPYTPRMKADEDRNLNPEHLRDIKLPEVAYFLGYFWADGHIHRYESSGLTHHRIAIEVKETDGQHLRKVVETFSRWAVLTRTRERTKGRRGNPMLSLVINNQPVYEFLRDHGYDDKSMIAPTAILAKIPVALHAAFWLGYLDGDGWLVSKRANMGFAGSHEQDWSALTGLLDQLGIKYGMHRQINSKGHKGSTVTVQNRRGIKAFHDYIKPFAYLGLPRKPARIDAVVRALEARMQDTPNLGKTLIP